MTDSFTKGEWNRLCTLLGDKVGDEWMQLARDIDFVWDSSMTVDNGVMGKFYPNHTIHLPGRFKLTEEQVIPNELIPTICHELTHYRQYREMGRLKWAFLNNPIWRRWAIEPDAFAVELAVEKQLGLNTSGGLGYGE